ncbi:MAG TPA: hypothetical protein DEA08_29295, partial [Planctomycetes bacterium]|nr:hypothetical protein [Planctomycetota bacterium]
VAHDFNNVLQAVLGLSELLKREELTEEAQTLTSEISTCVTRAADLTHRLLVFSRQEVRQRRRIDVVQE